MLSHRADTNGGDAEAAQPRAIPPAAASAPRSITDTLSQSLRRRSQYSSTSFAVLVNTSGAQNLVSGLGMGISTHTS